VVKQITCDSTNGFTRIKRQFFLHLSKIVERVVKHRFANYWA